MLQFAHCDLKKVKVMQTSSILRESIPLYYGQRKTLVFIIICAGLNLVKSHRVAVRGHSVCWLDIFRERYCHKSIDNFIKEAKAFLFKGSPT